MNSKKSSAYKDIQQPVYELMVPRIAVNQESNLNIPSIIQSLLKITPIVKSAKQNLIINHLLVIVTSTMNNCVNIDVTAKNKHKYVQNLVLKISVRDIHNNMTKPVSQGS